ncbi:CALR [Cordylochernes scorpioides]|uniref:CALR n=1 Tax=Cordylochernes scorpioides TaxID=51811 RepID=A0ABY6KAJ6_9ARAC|nr:CALR [Cordylochernes scorpioides]
MVVNKWEERWIQSEHKGNELGKFVLTHGKFYNDPEKDMGIQTSQDARFYAVSRKMEPWSNEGKTLVIQFSVKHEQNIDCGGGYVKVFDCSLDQKDLHGETPYQIMFGPDICGPGTKKVHVIFNYKGKNLLINKDIRCKDDEYTHLYTLIVKPDNTYVVKIDNEKVESGELEKDWSFLPPRKIKDPESKKPEDWDDREKIDDPEDSKPEDWEQPEYIPDPDAVKPEDWDDDMDGEWEPPQINNPAYKGEWKPRKIDNPNYKGPWIHPEIDNPEYTPDPNLYRYKDICAVGLDLWQVKSGSIFDNILVTDDEAAARKHAEETYMLTKEGEKKMKEKLDEEERKKMEAETKKEPPAEEDEEEDEDEPTLDETEEEKHDHDHNKWEDRWIQSEHKGNELGKFVLTHGKFYNDPEKDMGIQTSQDARFYAVSRKMEPWSNEGKTLVIQFSVKHEQNIDCGGGYVKVFDCSLDQKDLHGETPYQIMFGPDICGPGTKKVHITFNYKGKNLLINKDIRWKDDEYTHLYTLIVKPDNTYVVKIDNEKVESGELEKDWSFLPPRKIKDPESKKPEDWDDREKIDDPEDSKPEDWEQPEYIPDPDAVKPENWDDDMDGEWEPPQINNPAYKGEWKPRKIDNPNYKGPWIFPEIDNPEYTPDPNLYRYKDICAVGLDLWQVKSGSIFDNILVTDDEAAARKHAEETYMLTKEGEKKMKEKLDEEERKKMEAETKKEPPAEEDEEEDEDEPTLDETEEEKHDHDHSEL